MAKLTLNKLGLKSTVEIKPMVWNEQTIEVKQYLPIEEKLRLIEMIVNKSLDENPYYNPGRIKIFIKLETLFAYTNITPSDKQRNEVFKTYDLFSGELGDKILDTIPKAEVEFIESTVWEVIDSVYKHKNSALGILDSFVNDYDNLDLDATAIQQKLGDPNNMELLRAVLTKLG